MMRRRKFMWGDLSQVMPLYVTRKTANGETGSLSISVWSALLILLLVVFNIIVWGLIGLYEAARVVFG